MFNPTGFSNTIFKDRYALTQDETWEEACLRVAKQMALAEQPEKQKFYQDKFNDILSENMFVPGGRILYNSGRNNPQLLNCFVLNSELDSKEGWGNIAREMVVTSMTGGGCGIEFSSVRPRGASIKGQKGECPGPVELMRLIDSCSKPVRSGGQRRVALMFSLDLDHPDVLEFLDAKLTKGELTNANVSVRSKHTTDFLKAVKTDGDWELSWKGQYKKTIKARELWNKIVTNAYNSAEPGFLNLELAENESNISYARKLVTTNPCFAAGTMVLTKQGDYPIEKLVGKQVEIYSNGKWVEVSNFRVTGKNQKLLKVCLGDGTVIRCTPTHKFILEDGSRIEAENLMSGLRLKDSGADFDLEYRGKLFHPEFDTVTSVNPDGEAEEVYCCTVPETHSFTLANGIEVGNCGEIFLSSYDCCCLGHLVLSRFVSGEDLDWHLLANTIRTAVRFLDNVLTVNTYPLPEMQKESHSTRRIGLGTTALADTLALLGYRYGSEDGNKFVDKLYKFVAKTAYEASIMLAVEKGSFPLFDAKQHNNSDFMKRMPKKIRSLVEEHGIRNCAILTQAPTGTVSILSGNCSSGIEPMFAPAYERRYWDKDERKTELVFHPLFEQFMKEGREVSHFVGSHELSPKDHMEVQSIVQKWVDNAVSKTINMAYDFPVEEMSKLWLEYLPQLKGTTFYRENTRGFVNADGTVAEPPLKAIPIEEAKARYQEAHGVGSEQSMECPSGVCSL